MYSNNRNRTKEWAISSHQLSKLHTFEVAARYQSFSHAADELSLTPSAVSHRINILENELGFKLFHRYHRKIKLTNEGERVYSSLHLSLQKINQEIGEIKSSELSGVLSIYSRPSITQCWLVPKLTDFYQKYPLIDLNILTGNEYINFNNYNIDVAIYYDAKIPEGIHYEKLMSESIIPVCSPEYAEEHNLLDNPSALMKCTLLYDKQAWDYKSEFGEWAFWASTFGIDDLNKCRKVGFDRSDLSIISAINHGGVAIGRRHLIDKHISTGALVKPFPKLEIDCQHDYYAITPYMNQSTRVKVFIEWLIEIAREESK
ncbi:colanic acid biosynthesis glycosyltransferase WcaA [Photobacterium proteolyticum]|uniref:Colanic acid biosynthesis glycosyltransferase WcaA n=1 Tax=Photobacterium proteolyticum TaxID=1903952 RepID=A0A1Q9G5U3_9GAMM|nr:DNA-binding transcriptional regulator DsdC [Photobacterium proteolyticum]OLQ69307.1 colanic acid biosynthesis glycosyltransferase WcaA [Photobacterium proteolyticum]